MPPKANDILEGVLNSIHDRLTDLAAQDQPLNEDWISMSAQDVKSIIPRLAWWIEKGKTVSRVRS